MKTVTQNAPDITAPKAPITTPPPATPPATGTGLNAFVTGQGAGPKATGKGQDK